MAKTYEDSLTSEESQAFKVLYARIAALLQASQNVLSYALEPASPGSKNDLARRAQIWDAYEQVNPLLYSAEDHLRTILMIFEAPQLPTYALYTLARAAGEAIVRCAYLLDPDLTEQQRMARGLNLRLESLIEQNKVKRDDALYAERVATLEERAARNGIAVLKRNDAPATDFGERRTSDVELFSRYVQTTHESDEQGPPFGETLYRYLSAHAHSVIWVKLSEAETEETEELGMASVRLDLKFPRLAGILAVLLRTHERNIVELLGLSGYPASVWHDAMKTATADARARYVRLAERKAREKEAG